MSVEEKTYHMGCPLKESLFSHFFFFSFVSVFTYLRMWRGNLEQIRENNLLGDFLEMVNGCFDV